MGASISQRPGKCLKNRRTKSEEYLGSKRNFKNNMGRFFAPWHHFINENIANNNQDNVSTTRYFNYSDWVSKDISANMEKSFNEIHRTNSLDKNDYENDYEKLVVDNFANHCMSTNEDVDYKLGRGRLTIDVNKDSIFEVNLRKGNRGLGFSVLEYDRFIFIKQLFPLEAALQSGLLQEGDIILSANGTALTDLSSFEALQILRTLQNPVTLIVCRLQQFLEKKPVTSSHVFSNFQWQAVQNGVTSEEFEIVMKKLNGSLGFTLRKDEDDDYSHVVRALVKEPAISDGRIKPGDQIVSVNNQEIDKMTHQEAVKFLRDCGDEVTLKLRRDSRDTISSSLTSLNSSQFEANSKTLRKEALEMLSDLAVKKLKIESEDQQNNNIEGKTNSSFSSDGNLYALKRRDTLFDSRENLSALPYSDGCLTSHPLQDSTQLSGDFGKLADEPVSLPALDDTFNKISFRHNDPAYHSINVPNFSSKVNSEDKFSQNRTSLNQPMDKNAGLLKWKGIVLDAENEDKNNSSVINAEGETLTVQLQRNWNSRLGFSLSHENDATIISAIHADSVAAKNGRLRINDKLLEINGKNVRTLDTCEIIDMLRTVRGTVTITVHRQNISKQ